MLKTFLIFISSKGTMIGLFTGLLKIMLDIREGRFKWRIAITDITASVIVGYSVFVWASESEKLANWQIYGLTIFFSINAFLVVKIITEPSLVKKLISSWTRIDPK